MLVTCISSFYPSVLLNLSSLGSLKGGSCVIKSLAYRILVFNKNSKEKICPLPNKPKFQLPWERRLMKTLWENEKLLVYDSSLSLTGSSGSSVGVSLGKTF